MIYCPVVSITAVLAEAIRVSFFCGKHITLDKWLLVS